MERQKAQAAPAKADAMERAKRDLAAKRGAMPDAERAKVEELRRDVPPGAEIEAALTAAYADAEARRPVRLYAALHRAQAKFETVRKNGENPHFRSRYATLDEIWETVRGPLSEAGLVAFCTIEARGGERLLTTHVADAASGEEISCSFPIAAQAATPQAVGSEMTYARRYTLAALLEIVTGDGMDDDGAAADGGAKNPPAGAAAAALGF